MLNSASHEAGEALPSTLTAPTRPTLEAQSWVRAGLSRSHAYELMSRGEFPRPVKIGRASRFVTAEVDAWIASRMAARDAGV
jgi:predicted DNA-binding transcriptional regulator AlpA